MAGRQNRKRGKAGRSPETPEQMIDRVLDAFDRWLGERSPDAPGNDTVLDVARTACEFKATYVDPNPADWAADVATHIVGEVMPAKIIGVDADYVAAIVPGMLSYVDFLVQTGRWKAHNDERATRSAIARLGDLAPRFGDPGRQSMAGRVLQLAADEGVDFSDPAALDEFMRRFNEMPLEWRQRVTDGGAPDLPDLDDEPVDPVQQQRDAGIATGLAALSRLVTVLPDRPVSVTVPAADEEWAALAGTTLVTRVLDLAEWVVPGRTVTGTGALRLDDMRRWCDRWRLPPRTAAARSMWDVAAIALPWRIGLDCGVIDLDGTKVRRGSPTDGPVAERVRLGRAMVERLLDFVLVPMDIGRPMLDAINFVMLPMLRSMCVPPGQALAGLDAAVATPGPLDLDALYPNMMAGRVRRNIEMLREWGVIVESAGHAVIPDAVRPGVVQTINSTLAPFQVRPAAGAVPLARSIDAE